MQLILFIQTQCYSLKKCTSKLILSKNTTAKTISLVCQIPNNYVSVQVIL